MSQTDQPQTIARILSEALPFMQLYDNQVIVVKYGGHAMIDPDLSRKFARDIVQMKLSGFNPIVVHGGGPQIGSMLDRLNIKSRFEDGLRVTDKATMEVVEMVLAGSINSSVVTDIQAAGGKAIGISGKDGNLCVAKKLERTRLNAETGEQEPVDLGFVGDPGKINPEIKPAAEDLSELREPEMGRDRECHTSSCLYGQSPIVVRASRPQGDDSDYH